jgi:hypothetical protein
VIFFVILGFELRVSHLLNRHTLFCFRAFFCVFFFWRGSVVPTPYPHTPSPRSSQPGMVILLPIASCIAGITDPCHHTQLLCWDGSLEVFSLSWPWMPSFPVYASWAAGITCLSCQAQLLMGFKLTDVPNLNSGFIGMQPCGKSGCIWTHDELKKSQRHRTLRQSKANKECCRSLNLWK